MFRAVRVGRCAVAVKPTGHPERTTAASVSGVYAAWTTTAPGEKHPSILSCSLFLLLIHVRNLGVVGSTTVSESSTRSILSSFSSTLVSMCYAVYNVTAGCSYWLQLNLMLSRLCRPGQSVLFGVGGVGLGVADKERERR